MSHPSLEEKDWQKSIRTINGNASCITFTGVCNPCEDWNRQWRFVHGNWNQKTTERDLVSISSTLYARVFRTNFLPKQNVTIHVTREKLPKRHSYV